MTIGSLFIALGFKVTGRQQFDDARLNLKHAAIDATKLTLAINAVNVALLALMETGTRFAVGMKNFTLQTGLSSQELQEWQHRAEVNDVTAAELTETIKGLQDERAAFALGEPKNVGAWSLLGVDPRQDPFVVLDQLRTKLLAIQDVGIARNLAEKVGISANVFQMLRAANDEFSKWRKQFEVTKQQEERLIRLNRAWKDLRYNLTAIRVQLAAALAPALEGLATVLSWLTKKFAEFNAWLNSSAVVAKAFRFLLGALAIAFLIVGAASAVVAAGLAALSAMFVLLSPAVAALLPLLVEAAAFVALLTAFIVALVLAIDDMIMSFTGGKSVLRDIGEGIGEWLSQFDSVLSVMEVIDALLQKIAATWKALNGQKAFEKLFGSFTSDDLSRQIERQQNRGAAWFAPRNQVGGAGGSWTQENNVEINIDGARSPEATGKAVGRSVKEEINSAAYQMPVPAL